MIKKIVLWIAGTVLLLIALLSYIGYRSFNQEAFKNQIVTDIQAVTGRKFLVNGPYHLTWDPLPTMTLENVTLSNIENSPNQEMLRADKIQVQIEWASLFKNPTQIKNIILTKPIILVERISRSITNLNFPVLFTAKDVSTNGSSFDGNKKRARIDNIHIDDGTIQYINHMTKREFQLSQLTGEIAISSLSGPFGFEGSGSWNNVPVKMDFSISEREISKPMDFSAKFTSSESKSQLKIDGQLAPEESEKYLTGHISFDTQNPNILLRQIGLPDIPNANNKPSVGNLAFDMGVNQATFSDGILKLGDDESDIAVNFNLTQTDNAKSQNLVLNVNTLNLNEWEKTFITFLEQKRLTNLPSTNFEINVSNIFLGNKKATSLQLVGLTAPEQKNTETDEITPDQIHIEKGFILLPGSTTVRASGLTNTDLSNWTGLAQVELQTQNLSEALPFLPVPEKLSALLSPAKKAEINLALEWAPVASVITVPAFLFDNTTGTLQYEKAPDQPVQIELELNNFDLNQYMEEKDKKYSSDQLLPKLFKWIGSIDMPKQSTNLKLVLDQLTIQNALFDKLIADITTNGKTLQIEAVGNTSKQDSFVLQTEIENSGTSDWQITKNVWDIQSQNLSQMFADFGIENSNKFIKNTAIFSSKGNISGKPDNWNTTFVCQAQYLTLEGNGQLSNGKPHNLAMRLTHSSMPHLLADLLEQNPLDAKSGTVQAEAILNQENNLLNLSNFVLSVDQQILQGNVVYDTQTRNTQITLAADSLDITKFLPSTDRFYSTTAGFDGTPFQLDFVQNLKGELKLEAGTLTHQNSIFKKASVQAHLENGTFTLDDFMASGENEVGSTVQASGSVVLSNAPSFNLKITTQNLPIRTPFTMFEGIGLSGGRLTSEWELTSSGETPLQLARTLSGKGIVYLKESTFMGSDFSNFAKIVHQAQANDEQKQTFEPKLKRSLANGSTAIEQIKGTFSIEDGLWQLNGAQLTTKDMATKDLSIKWDIPTAVIKSESSLKLKEYSSLPDITLSFLKDKRGVNYKQDIDSFATALAEEIERQKVARNEAAIKAKKDALEKEVNDAKQLAQSSQEKLYDMINETARLLEETSNVDAQKSLTMSNTTYQNLMAILQEDNLTIQQYQYVTEHSQKAIGDLTEAQKILFNQKVQNAKQKASTFVEPADELLAKLNTMYQKRPTVTVLADLLQNAEKQRTIIKRAVDQFKKDLTFEQVKKISKIIEDAYEKISKAYNYAEEIYSGRQALPTNNNIKRAN